MGEPMIERMKKMMNKQINIRNICTSAHIHHGKCIAENTRLILADGSIKIAKDIFEEVAGDGAVFEENEEHIIFSPNKRIEIFTLNKTNRRIEKKEIQYVWRLAGGKTIKVRLRNGFEIETTPEHKYVVLNEGNFLDVEAKDLKLGDRIVCSRKLETKSNLNIKKEILERLSNENFYVNLKKEFAKLIKEKILNYGIKELANKVRISVKVKSFYHGIWQNRYNLKDLVSICKIFDFNLEEVYDKIDLIFYRTGKQRGQNSLKVRMPQNFEEFFYIAGLFLGDGSGKKFIVGKEELGEKLIETCRKLGINAIKRQWKEKTPEIHTNITLVYMLKGLFDYPSKNKSHNIKISEFVFNSEKRYIANLLRGYFDCDGSVEKARRAVTISSVSDRMIADLHLLLLRFGCIAIKEKDNALSISGSSALNFMRNICFSIKEKEERLRLLVTKISGSIVCDTVKVGNNVMLINKLIKDKCDEDLAYIEVKSIEQGFQDTVYDFTVPETHNFIAEGIVIHNTAFTDNLLAAAGLMAEAFAGDLDKGMATWQHADEQERLLTVDAANVSMVHEYQGEEYLINLIDTPGHIDFSGNVTRAMRAIDGTIVLVCASEGIMPQTETVLKQALRERVKPVLFINKVDRLIKEMLFTPEQVQERITKIIVEFNKLIEDIAEKEYKKKWQVNIQDGSVAFGSARENWALSLPFMQKKNIAFKDILNAYKLNEEEKKGWFWEKSPLHDVVLDMVTKHLPNPLEAQKYRIPKIWHGELESEIGKSLLNCNPNGKLAFCMTRILIDPKSGREISAGRLYSGTMREGMQLYINNISTPQRVQNVYMYQGIKTQPFESVPAGNVLAITGIKGYAGDTITESPDEQPFEELKHIFEPVITKSIEVTKPQELPKLVEVLRMVAKEDPSIKIVINEETGENLMSGMGELHLEIIENRIKTEKLLQVKTSDPIVVYRETITKKSGEVEGKTPNKHNKFYFYVEPLEPTIIDLIKRGELPEMRFKKKDLSVRDKLVEAGMDSKAAVNVKDIFKGNILIEQTRGLVHIGEVMEMVLDMFEDIMAAGPLAKEPCIGVKVVFTDAKLHEDAIHRGPAQVYPAVRDGIRGAMMQAKPIMFEPYQILEIEAPNEYMGELSKLVNMKRGQLLNMEQEGNFVIITAKMPVAELLGWSSDLRSATEGRGNSSLVDQMFEKVPEELQQKVIMSIRNRKGLTESMVGV